MKLKQWLKLQKPKKIRNDYDDKKKKDLLEVSQEKKRLSNLFLPSNNFFVSFAKMRFCSRDFLRVKNEQCPILICFLFFGKKRTLSDHSVIAAPCGQRGATKKILRNQNMNIVCSTESLILFVFIFLNFNVGKVKTVILRVNLSNEFFFENFFRFPLLKKERKKKTFCTQQNSLWDWKSHKS